MASIWPWISSRQTTAVRLLFGVPAEVQRGEARIVRFAGTWKLLWLHAGLVTLLALMASACSSISLQSAVALGNTGVQTSTTYQQAIAVISPGLDNFLEGQYMLAALDPAKYSEPNNSLVNSIKQIQSALSARAVLLGRLSQLYTSFVALASYDASGQVKSGLTSLDGAIDNYASALGSASPLISSAADSAISDAGGIIASEIQKHMVLKASEAIVPRLNAISGLLATENSKYGALQDEITRGLRDTTLVLWEHGVGAPDPILSSQIGPFGLTYVTGSYAQACKNVVAAAQDGCKKQFDSAIEKAVGNRAARVVALQGQSIASNQAALNGLIAAHGEFEKGKPLDLTAITEQLAAISAVVADINSAQKSNSQKK
jgi:hypothetical protein